MLECSCSPDTSLQVYERREGDIIRIAEELQRDLMKGVWAKAKYGQRSD